MNDQDLISLIIPCYNSEKTLEKCLASVTSQSYQNLEIIIINDGSTDWSSQIIRRFQDNDARILLIDQKNTGVSQARNNGFKKATGKYICFVDSDDWVDRDYCSVMQNAITENGADIVVAEAFYEDSSGKIITRTTPGKTNIYTRKKALELLLEDKIIQSHPWAKLYKAELFEGISFPENMEAFEDYYVMFRVFGKSEKVVKISQPIYHYVQLPNSLSHNLTPIRAYNFFLALIEAYHFLQAQNFDRQVKSSIVKNILKKCFMVLKRIIRNTNEKEMLAEKKNIRKEMAGFFSYSAFEIGLEYYFYLRFFIYFPKKYSRFVNK